MSASVTQQMKTLQLCDCNLGDIEMSCLLEHAIKSDSVSTLEYVDLSRNRSSPWGVYCAIIRKSRVSSLTLSGEKGMQEYVNDIIDSLQTNTALKSLTLCSSTLSKRYSEVVIAKNIENTLAIDGKLLFNTLVNVGERLITLNNDRMVNIKILYDYNHACLSQTNINLSSKHVNDDTVCLITLGLYNNTMVKELDISYNNVTDNGAIVISNFLKHNNTLQKLNISHNSITNDGVEVVSDSLRYNNALQELDLSHNNITMNGAVCISNLLKCNKTLQKLGISHNSITDDGVAVIFDRLKCNKTLQKLDISHSGITNDGAMVISDCLNHSNTIKELNLSHNNIDITGMDKLSECVKHTTSLQYIDLSENTSSPWKVYCAIIRHCHSNNLILCGDKGIQAHAKEIIDNLQTNTTLQSLTLYGYMGIRATTIKSTLVISGKLYFCTPISDNDKKMSSNNKRVVHVEVNILYYNHHECLPKFISMSKEGINDDMLYLVTLGLYNNTTVKKLDLSYNKITDDGILALSNCLKHNCSLEVLKLSGNSISCKGAKSISEAMHKSKIQKLDLSRTCISVDGVIAISEYLMADNTLRLLNLSDNPGIRDDGVMYISDSLKANNTLLELNLSRIGIGDKGANSIARAVQVNRALQKLDLSCNYISKDMVTALNIHLEHHRKLKAEVIWKSQLQIDYKYK